MAQYRDNIAYSNNNNVSHHSRNSSYARVHSNSLDSGNVTVGLTTIEDNDSPVDTTTLYLTPELAEQLHSALGKALAEAKHGITL